MAAPRVLMIDNFDSFTFILVDYLRRLGAQVQVARNDAVELDDALADRHQAIVISPGPGTPDTAGLSVPLAAACIERRRPLLGVCLGHQAIAAACGSAVEKVEPVHGKTEDIRHDGSGVFRHLPSPFAAARYHSLAVPNPGPPLRPNAWGTSGLVMGMQHHQAPVHGVQFHPESVATEHGLALLARFLDIAAATRA